MHLIEMASRIFHGISQVEYYIKSHYKPHSSINENSIYMAICNHEDDFNVYDERPCYVIRAQGSDLKSNEVEVYRISKTITNKKLTCVLKDYKKEGLTSPSEIKLYKKFKISKHWLGPELGQLTENDFERIAWAKYNN